MYPPPPPLPPNWLTHCSYGTVPLSPILIHSRTNGVGIGVCARNAVAVNNNSSLYSIITK